MLERLRPKVGPEFAGLGDGPVPESFTLEEIQILLQSGPDCVD